ncbi:hypothetical protein [Kribbella sp. VKM Ac-2568]|uniref:hypothetical protein n=1 Tax=Kribbella sp. VKM Ac-2568 TaxID=2512219 RepID=UPI001051F3A9|nr:hypothetical protein [Kribbella sp. VKM Ac-2568]TCM47055.1 hypothetical protein EV648_105535 [Kribbella sp. VKM Ac-2568]
MTKPPIGQLRSRLSATIAVRTGLAVVGVGVGLWGLGLLLQSLSVDALIRLPLWLAGAVIANDFFLVPLTISVGWMLARWSIGPGHHRTVTTVRTMLLYAGITTLVAIPLLLRQGKGVNPTVLPRNYLRDWLLLEATIVLVGVLVAVVQGRRLTFRRSRASSGDIGGR